MTPDQVFELVGGTAAQQNERQRRVIRELIPIADNILALQTRQTPIPTAELAAVIDLADQITAARGASEYIAGRVPDVRSIRAALASQLEVQIVTDREGKPPSPFVAPTEPEEGSAVANAVTFIDRLFAANPPDP